MLSDLGNELKVFVIMSKSQTIENNQSANIYNFQPPAQAEFILDKLGETRPGLICSY